MSISLRGKMLIGASTVFKKVTSNIDPSNKRLDVINNIMNIIPGPFLLNRVVEPFKLTPLYDYKNDLQITGDVVYKNNQSVKDADSIIFYIHGGAFLLSDHKRARFMTSNLCKHSESPIVSFDYRFGHNYPFPYALMDTIQVYKWFINKYDVDQKKIVVMGDSAGGNLSVALITLICLENLGHDTMKVLITKSISELLVTIYHDPDMTNRPKGLVLISPWLDLTQNNESYSTNANKDTLLPPEWIPYAAKTYLGQDLLDPHFLASPHNLPSDLLKYFPPTLIHVCENEMLLDDSKNFADNMPNDVSLKIFPPLPHVFHLAGRYVPESREAIIEIAEFIKKLN
ncbi:MAG: hypothetical protein Terrestrivirus5_3 [Terrestrivirus sp.]|uniref:Alpha/beta hydrolase fold-3 domain-containing protein n=1 Tax=Terrestrivirus sp. TaxID=2487775 RepID=A0A3G4ZQB4_9VIRU|nr:MAG: hypothetical protein Terrestrivirus5_3 [Terrestrivirus sp.]